MPLELNPLVQPPAGSVSPADLYIDRASRQLWLGVDLAVDSSGSVLIADIIATLAAIDEAEASAKTYTDAQVATRALASHTHPSSQITDFAAAVDARIAAAPATAIPVGTMMLYGGALNTIGVGDMAAWVQCDGRSLLRADYPALFAKLQTTWGFVDGTHFNIPNLNNRFVIGAAATMAVKNDATAFVTAPGGAHSHGGATDPTTLTIAQLPNHDHGPGDLRGVANGNTSVAGTHTHDIKTYTLGSGVGHGPASTGTSGASLVTEATQGAEYTGTGGSGADHYHPITNVPVALNAGTTANVGSNSGHSHPISSEAAHTHGAANVNAVRDALNWVTVPYIIKLY